MVMRVPLFARAYYNATSMSEPPVRPRDAASLLILRDSPQGPQLFMLRRHPSSRFMANALVFVGGAVDEADGAAEVLGCCSAPAAQEGAPAPAFYVTAIRECFEESGLLLARRTVSPDPLASDELAAMRGALLEGATGLADQCRQHQLELRLDELRYFDRWITPEIEPLRFDARFFVARAPAGQEASFDAREMSFGAWLTAAEALAEDRARRQVLPPPTRIMLERLSEVGSVDAVLADAATRPVSTTTPRQLPGATSLVLMLPTDHRYDDPGSPSGPIDYFTLEDDWWVRVRG
jgi:8-oxo-dGTP pyrophosphatase MutT (NUDIX family)